MRQGCLIKIRWILLWRIQNSSCNSETIWGQYGLKCLLLVYFHSNIILKMHFVSWGCLEAVFTKTWFCFKTKASQILAFKSISNWSAVKFCWCKFIVIDRANIHIEDYNLKFTDTWLWLDFVCARAKFAKSWLDCLDAFHDCLTFKKWAYSECWQNFELVEVSLMGMFYLKRPLIHVTKV